MIDDEDEELEVLFKPMTPSFIKTPRMLHGVSISNGMFFNSNSHGFNGQKIDVALLTRVVSLVLGSDVEDDDWEQVIISSYAGHKGGAVIYSYPINNNKKFYRCVKLECGINIRVDNRLLGLAATIHAHVYLAQKATDYEKQRKHMGVASAIREYCYQVAGRAGYDEFTTALFDMLCADILTFYEDDW